MLLDTSVLIEMFTDDAKARQVESEIGKEEAYVSMVQIAELAAWAIRVGRPVRERIETTKELASVLPLDEEDCREAASIRDQRRKAGKNDFGIIDGILLATARSRGQRLLTFDRHFEGEEDCVVLG